MDCVMNFIALGVIAEIDNLYAASLRSEKVKAVLAEENQPPYTKGGLTDFNQNLWIKYLRVIYRGGMIIFVSLYFYFLPFTTIAISQLFSSAKEIPAVVLWYNKTPYLNNKPFLTHCFS